jgi:ABC-type bacteriocin/lantibiotic exporter with double-glycine peptidase domain
MTELNDNRGARLKLSIENVGKCYGGKAWALRRFSLELRPGVLGLLGPNGAGKTTLMSILATITRASEGKVTWNGADVAADPNALRAVLGYLPQDRSVAEPGEFVGRAGAAAGRVFGRDEAAGGDCAGAAERSAAADCG